VLTINQGDFDGVNLAGLKALDDRTAPGRPHRAAGGRTGAAVGRGELERLRQLVEQLLSSPPVQE
jgi:hypothetical protein